MYARIFTLYMLSLWLANDGITFAQNSKSVGKDTLSMSYLLSEVVVTASKVKYRYQDNTLIYKVVDDEGAKFAISTVDILRRTPLVTIGANNTPMIQGNSKIKVLIDGKELYGIPSSQVLSLVAPTDIQRIEVSTMPSAMYAAESIGGVINIITSRQHMSSFSGAGNIGIGSKGSHISMTLLSPLSKNWSINTNLYGLIGYSHISTSRSWISTGRFPITWRSEATGNSLAQLYNGSITLSYHRNPSKFDVGVRFFAQYSTLKERDKGKLAKLTSGNDVYNLLSSYEYKLNPVGSIKAYTSLLYTPISNRLEINGQDIRDKQSLMLWLNDISLNLPIRGRTQMVAGGRWAKSQIFHGSRLSELINQQSILSIYLEFTHRWSPRLSAILGLRYERWERQCEQQSSGWFLNSSLTYDLDIRTKLSVGVGQRISRPSLSEQITGRKYVSEVLYVTGNPNVESAKPIKMEISLSRFLGANFLKFSLFHEHSKRSVAFYMRPENEELVMSPVNLSKHISYGANAWGNLSLFRGDLSFSSGLNVQHVDIRYSDIFNKGWMWDFSVNIHCRLGKYYAINFFGSLQSKKIHLQGYSLPYTYSNLSIERFFGGEGTSALALSVDNPFTRAIKEQKEYHTYNDLYSDRVEYFNRGIRLIFKYRFGKKNIEDKDIQPRNILNDSL